MVWYVLNNTKEVEPFIEIYMKDLQTAGSHDVEGNLAKEFPGWFRKHDVLLMVSDITPWNVRAVEEHKTVELWLRAHIMEKI